MTRPWGPAPSSGLPLKLYSTFSCSWAAAQVLVTNKVAAIVATAAINLMEEFFEHGLSPMVIQALLDRVETVTARSYSGDGGQSVTGVTAARAKDQARWISASSREIVHQVSSLYQANS